MKKLLLLSAIALLGIFVACNKDIDEKWTDLEPLNPVKTDAQAGTWSPVLLTAPDEIPLAPPSDVASAAFMQELATTRQIVGSLTDAQREIIRYWSAGSVLRWNQILRELVAKYNLAPAPDSDGTYPAPDANNPFTYPQFPFANPPYAARAYAYVSVAQYDALVAAFYYKSLYSRPSAWQADPGIQPITPKSTLYGYPCEDAVIAGASLEMLKFLFPAEVNYLQAKADEAAWYKQWAGVAVASDVTAGLELGKAIAQKALNRAKTDGTKNANGTAAERDSLVQRTIAGGETPWLSLDAPARPPMLPFFGRVKPWLFPASELAVIRPPQPPSVFSAQFKAELEEVKREADPNDRDKMRIVHFWADGTGTYTPPGHWNAFAADDIYLARWSEVRSARAFALLNMALMDAAIGCWEAKYHYYVPRPTQIDPSIKTLTGVPNFPAYTSGHSTFSAAGATVLGYLFPSKAGLFDAYAQEASISRLYGGIHYRMDCEQGIAHGQRIGQYAVSRGQSDGAE